jgi:hypothetical protein
VVSGSTASSSSSPDSSATASPAPSATGTAAPVASGHHGSGVHAGDESAFLHVAGVVVILLIGALGCAVSLRRAAAEAKGVRDPR